MKFELSISANYLSGNKGWDTWAGIREIIQNGRDAEIEHGAELTVKHIPESNTIVVENDGCIIPREALLIGHSSKRENRSMAGYFGEGLKLGALVLVRGGARIKIRTGSEVWTPSLQESEKFGGQQVLVMDVETGREAKNRVRIEIQGIDKELWHKIRDRFLFLEPRSVSRVTTPSGELLKNDRFKGRIYVKGIFVAEREGLQYGYNFLNFELDRDRRVLDSFDTDNAMRLIWSQAVEADPELSDDLYRMLEKNHDDVKGLSGWGASYLPDSFKADAATRFQAKYGAEAIPVKNLAESKDIEHFGVRGVVTSESLASVLATTLGTTETVRARLAQEVTRTYSWGELKPVERKNLERAVDLVERASKLPEGQLINLVDVVDFRSDGLQGQFKGGRVVIARRMLTDRKETLAVIVHEVAHTAGGDGDKSHVSTIEALWAAIVESLS